jgi:hypothetical protein
LPRAGGRFDLDVVRDRPHPKPHVSPSLDLERVGVAGRNRDGEATAVPFTTAQGFIILDKTGGWAEFLLFGPRQATGGS